MRRPTLTLAILCLVLAPAATPLLLAASAPSRVPLEPAAQPAAEAVQPSLETQLGTVQDSEADPQPVEEKTSEADFRIVLSHRIKFQRSDRDGDGILDGIGNATLGESGIVESPTGGDSWGYASDFYWRADFTMPDNAETSAPASQESYLRSAPEPLRLRAVIDPSVQNVGSGLLDSGTVDEVSLRASPLAAANPASEPSVDLLFSLMVATSQESLALFGLAPYPGASHGPPSPSLQMGPGVVSQAKGTEIFDAETLALPGWWLQATWAVALSAFVAWAFVAAGLPAIAVRLFSRFDRDDVLDHGRRATLFECIRAEPGVSFGQLAERASLAPGVAQHHLKLLEQHELVRRVRDGRTTRFYPKGPKFPSPVTLAPRRSQIVEILKVEPGLNACELAGRLGQRVQSTWDHLNRLRQAGVLQGEKHGRSIGWRIAAVSA